MNIKTPLCLLVVLMAFSCGSKLNAQSHDTPFRYTPNYKHTLDSLVPKLLIKYKVPAAGVGIINQGNIDFIKVYGNHQKGLTASSNTIFNVASITKPVVAATILKLIENGDWDLDEPLYHYFTDPDVKNDSLSKLLTTKHCLTHTSGFKNWRWDEVDTKLKFNFKPGTKFQYSGEGMEYLRKAVERKFNIGLEKLVDSIILKPFGMKDTNLGWNLKAKDTLRFAKWYNTHGKLHDIDYKITNVNAADDMLTTIEDMLLFGNAIMKQELISDKSLFQKMISPQVPINSNTNQGLGWVVSNTLSNGEYILNHDGGDPGVVATLILLPKSNNGIVIFTNGDNGASITNTIVNNTLINGIQIIEKLHWDNPIPQKIKIEGDLLKKYSGTYTTDKGFSISFSVDTNSLLIDSVVFPRLSLFPKSDMEFFPLPFEVYFKFIPTEKPQKFQLLSRDGKIELEGIKLE